MERLVKLLATMIKDCEKSASHNIALEASVVELADILYRIELIDDNYFDEILTKYN